MNEFKATDPSGHCHAPRLTLSTLESCEYAASTRSSEYIFALHQIWFMSHSGCLPLCVGDRHHMHFIKNAMQIKKKKEGQRHISHCTRPPRKNQFPASFHPLERHICTICMYVLYVLRWTRSIHMFLHISLFPATSYELIFAQQGAPIWGPQKC